METITLHIEELIKEPYASIICYPKASKAELKKRLRELQKLGVKAIEFSGEKEAFNTLILGKGCVGIVVIAHRNSEKIALKIRRVDADRNRMFEEAEKLKIANSVGVGPRFLDVSKNFLLMQFVDGELLPNWLEKRVKKDHVKAVLREILEQCWLLDNIGLDHGELSRAPKHIIINSAYKPCIIDFETASLNRRPSNVTSICQFLFISGQTAQKIAEKIGEANKKAIIEALRSYKQDKTKKNFEKILEACRLKL
ncbi:MAG: RIO1 family regulatory kinase/ATPase [Candidatus Bathyarchaeales archaeon]